MSKLEPTAQERQAAEAYGRDAWTAGVAVDGARAYSERPHIQQAWRDGWQKAETEQRRRRGEPEDRFHEITRRASDKNG